MAATVDGKSAAVMEYLEGQQNEMYAMLDTTAFESQTFQEACTYIFEAHGCTMFGVGVSHLAMPTENRSRYNSQVRSIPLHKLPMEVTTGYNVILFPGKSYIMQVST